MIRGKLLFNYQNVYISMQTIHKEHVCATVPVFEVTNTENIHAKAITH